MSVLDIRSKNFQKMKKNYIICILLAFCTFSCIEDVNMPEERKNTDKPVLTAEKNPEAVTYNSATLNANIESANGYKIFARGFIYGLDSSLTGDTDSISTSLGDNYGLGSFELELKNLLPDTKYYYVAFATNEKGTQYSEVMEFSTWPEIPIVETGDFGDIYAGNALISGNITYIGATPIEECGICFSLTSEKPVYEDDNTVAYHDTENIFAVTLNKLAGSRSYYVRAYAKNNRGVAYGETKILQTPAIWENAPEFPGAGRISYTVFTVSNNFYVAAGENKDSYPLNDLWEFKPASNSWSSKTYMSGYPKKAPSSFVIGNKAYVGFGISGLAANLSEILSYQQNVNDWRNVETPFPGKARSYACSFSIDSIGYIVGGRFTEGDRDYQTLSDVWKYEYNGSAWVWKSMAPFPVPIHEGVSFAYGNKAFVGLGTCIKSAGDLYYNSIWTYDQENDSWEKITTIPTGFNFRNGGITGVTVVENNAYLIDGSNQIWVLNLDSYVWNKKSDMPISRSLADNQCMFSYRNESTNEYEVFVGLNHLSTHFYKYRPEWDNPVK